jgi:hypothetical protein
MEIANARLRLNKVGSDVPLVNITPAEAMFLHIIHGPSNGGSTFGEEFEKLTVVGTAKVQVSPAVVDEDGKITKPAVLRDRTDAEELRRLTAKYSGARTKDNKPIIDGIWPDKFSPKLPQTFKDIKWMEVSANASGVELAAVNYATGGLATSSATLK